MSIGKASRRDDLLFFDAQARPYSLMVFEPVA